LSASLAALREKGDIYRNMSTIVEELSLQMKNRGYKCGIVSIQHLYDLQEEIELRRREGLFDEEFYRGYLTGFTFAPRDSLPEANSLMVVAVPQPQIQVVFTWNEKAVPLIVPPTYLYKRETDKEVEDLLTETLAPAGYRVAQAALPKKLLAVRSGLGEYGRNNICYVPEMGSFHRLVAFYSDFACQEDSWRESQMMERCQNCYACRHNCPTGAITSERFLLLAERCITFRNEKPGDVPFPAWIDPSWHNCLVGCLHCQRVCPENKDFLPWIEGDETFSEEETAFLVEGVSLERLPVATAKKVERLDLIEYLDLLPRNLSVIFNR
jgi:epoxyqueuosine reductase